MAYRTILDPCTVNTDLECKTPSLTQKQYGDEVDINYIMAKFQKTGILPTLNQMPNYDDFSVYPDFKEAQEIVLRANADFNSLPSKIRERFGQDVNKFLQFFNDEENRPEAERLGLINKKEQNKVVPKVDAQTST